MAEIDGALERVRGILDGVLGDQRADRPNRAALYRDVTRRIGRECRERLDDVSWEALCVAFGFHLDAAADDRRAGDVQYVAFGGGSVPFELNEKYPPATTPCDLPDEVGDVWRVLGRDESLHPALQARTADLMWTRKDRTDGLRWFEVAVDAYVRLSARADWHILDRCMGLRRAITIAAETPGAGLMDRCDAAARRMIRASLTQGDGEFGIVYPLLGALVSHGREVDDLLDDAIDVYRGGPDHHHDLLGLKAAARSDLSADVARRQIEAFEQHADCQSGLGKLHWLRRALATAQRHGDTESVERLLVKIQNCDPHEDMQSASFEVEVEAEGVEAVAEQFATGTGLEHDLTLWSISCPLHDEATERTNAEERIAQFPLQHLVHQVVIGDDNAVRDIEAGSEDQIRQVMREGDGMSLQMFGSLYGRETLRRICDANADELDRVEELFVCPWIERDEARRIAQALERWRDGQLELDDVRLLTLCVEPTVREILRLVDQPVIRPSRRGRSAETEPVSLGTLLHNWQEIPETRRRYFIAALTDPDILPIRTQVGHGRDAEIHPETAFILIFHIMCCLRFSTLTVTSPQPAST
ncbi:MAG: hypothetical protein OXH86_06965 [Acidimicrobiaceae bacterium]|nr:hypothetical protein [Acidimicrobiaceae bacterium]MDE0497075.1 hypothetical protein [Acidimicrobiaceae bacterium]